ncbi:hypothetical protein KY284_036024 [Solanum tuberosum]|nr:hypothetical protein KY284_036024 [Solanum tuberosum]
MPLNFRTDSLPTAQLSKGITRSYELGIEQTRWRWKDLAAELVAVQSLASLRGDDQPNLLEEELRSPKQVLHSVQIGFNKNPKSFDVYSEREEEEEVPLVWRKKGVRGRNALTVGVPDLEAVEGVTDTKLDNEPTKSGRERKLKGKGKMVESHTKGDKKRYVTRGEVQKVIESVIAGNEIQTERNIKRRRDGHVPKGLK